MEVRAERRFTLADIYDAPEDLARREIIDGVLYVSPSPRVGHQRVIRHLVLILDAWCRQHGGEVLPGGVNLDLGEDTHLEPDVAVLAPGRPVPDGSTRALTTPPTSSSRCPRARLGPTTQARSAPATPAPARPSYGWSTSRSRPSRSPGWQAIAGTGIRSPCEQVTPSQARFCPASQPTSRRSWPPPPNIRVQSSTGAPP